MHAVTGRFLTDLAPREISSPLQILVNLSPRLLRNVSIKFCFTVAQEGMYFIVQMTIRENIFQFVPLKQTVFAYKEPRYASRLEKSCLEKRSERIVKAIYCISQEKERKNARRGEGKRSEKKVTSPGMRAPSANAGRKDPR